MEKAREIFEGKFIEFFFLKKSVEFARKRPQKINSFLL
jgi:hypothetical protein